MSDAALLLTMLACGAVTFLIRLSFIAGERWLPTSARLQKVLGYVPSAVLAALIAPELLMRDGTVLVSVENPRLLAGIAAIVVAYYSRSVMATIAAGMAALWLLQWFA